MSVVNWKESSSFSFSSSRGSYLVKRISRSIKWIITTKLMMMMIPMTMVIVTVCVGMRLFRTRTIEGMGRGECGGVELGNRESGSQDGNTV